MAETAEKKEETKAPERAAAPEQSKTSASAGLATEAWNEISRVVGSVESTAESAISGFKSALSSLATTAGQVLGRATAYVFSKKVDTLSRELGELAEAVNDPARRPSTLTQVAPDQWRDAQGRYTVQKVQSFGQHDSMSGMWQQVNQQFSSASEVTYNSRDIYNSRAKHYERGDNRQYINLFNQLSRFNIRPGSVEYTAQDANGRTVTRAHRTENQAVLEHEGQRATLQLDSGTLTLESKEWNVLQTRDRSEVRLNDGRTLRRADGKLTLLDSSGQEVQSVSENRLRVGNVEVFANRADMHRDNTPAQSARVQVAADGSETRLVLPDATTVSMHRDGTALIRSASGQFFFLDRNKQLFKREDNGTFAPVTNQHPRWIRNVASRIPSPAPAANAAPEPAREVQPTSAPEAPRPGVAATVLPGVHIDSVGRIQTQCHTMDLDRLTVSSRPTANVERPTNVQLQPHGVTIETPQGRTDVQGTTAVTTTTDGTQIRSEFGSTPSIETPRAKISRDEIRLRDERGRETIVRSDNTVEMPNGVTLHNNGAMRLDARTFIGADGFVQAGNWASFAFASGGTPGGSSDTTCIAGGGTWVSNVDTNGIGGIARNASTGAMNLAYEIESKMGRRALRPGDISKAVGTIADLNGLLGGIPTSSALYAQVKAAIDRLNGAVNAANPALRQAYAVAAQNLPHVTVA